MRHTKESLEAVVPSCDSVSEVARRLNVKPGGGGQTHLSKKIKQYGIDTSHFLGNKKARITNCKLNRKQWHEVLVHNAGLIHRLHADMLRRCLVDYGKEPVCDECGLLSEWNGKPLVLHVDHVDGNWKNNLPDNLRFMCPNCHSQTETWGNKKRSNVQC